MANDGSRCLLTHSLMKFTTITFYKNLSDKNNIRKKEKSLMMKTVVMMLEGVGCGGGDGGVKWQAQRASDAVGHGGTVVAPWWPGILFFPFL